MSQASYAIEARAYDIIGVAAHDFWVLRDAGGAMLGQLHGLATNADNKILPIGGIGDRLKFYHFGPRAILFGLEPKANRNYIKPGQQSRQIYSGAADEVLARWDLAVKALPYLNSLDVAYTPFGIFDRSPVNSNTAYALLARLMGIEVHCFSGCWQPGWRNAGKILTSAELSALCSKDFAIMS